MEQHIQFSSAGLTLSGVLHLPEDHKEGQRRAAVIVLHGFGSNKNGGMSQAAAAIFAKMGYVVLRFDMRGCGDSEGPRGRVICMEQVEDARAAISFLEKRPEVIPGRIALMGHSFGAAVAIYTAGIDKRASVCISTGGWGDGEKKFRKQHASPQAWKKFEEMMQEGRKQLQAGNSMMVPRFDIVPIPPGLRDNLPPGAIAEFPYEVVESMFAFRAIDVVGQIAPRPLLLLHPSNDSVTPTTQSIELFEKSGQPTDLHLVAGTDHFMLTESNPEVVEITRNWMDKRFPCTVENITVN